MAESEVIRVLKDFDAQVTAKADGAYQTIIGKMACDAAIKALEEVQQYRTIGTVEELKAAMKYVYLAKKHGTVGQVIENCVKYEEIGTPEECLRNTDFLDFLSDKMNPNDFETYLRLYNALEEKGCEE